MSTALLTSRGPLALATSRAASLRHTRATARLIRALSGPFVRRRARRLLIDGQAVILDVETTDFAGAICQIAIIDTHGRCVLASLVNPGEPCHPGATAVHGLRDDDLRDAPTWSQLWPAVHQALAGKTVLAYNADFDRGRLIADCVRSGIEPGAWADPATWWCVMRARAVVTTGQWQRLGASHDAHDDAIATLKVLRGIAYPQQHATTG